MNQEAKEVKEVSLMEKEAAPSMLSVEETRATQEVRAQMVIAKEFPRDEIKSRNLIKKACERESLAELAQYVYPRGNTQVTGPSIRLMETIARCWTNLNYGLIEMTQADGTSDVIAFAWDLETNIRASRQFKVAHQRKAHGKVVDLTDPRDVYEMVANQGQRRVRACIEAVIPRDIVEEAIGVCNGTLAGNTEESLEDRALKIVQAFDKLGVTQAMLELKLGHPMKATIEQELADLRKIYTSIRDGVAKREDFFQIGPKEESPDSREMTEGLHEDAEGEKTEPEEKELTQFDKDVAKHKEDYPDCEYEPTSPRGLAQHLAKSHKKDDKEAGEQGSLGDWAAGAEEKDPFEEEFEKRVSELETDLPNVNIETMNEYLGIMAPKKNYKSVDELKKAIMHHDTFDPMWNGYLKWLMPKQNSK